MCTIACGLAWCDMATYDNTYSRVVAWLKIILPLLALAILSTLFLVARTIDPARSIPFADVDIEELTREQRIGGPNYSGITADGTAIRLRARQAKPDLETPDRIIGFDIDATLDLADGRSFDVTALSLVLDNANQFARLEGSVLIISNKSVEMRTQALELALKTTRVTSDTETIVIADGINLLSGSFLMTGDGNADSPYQMVFKDGIKLVYDPEGNKGP